MEMMCFSISVVLTKTHYFSFLRKVFVFQKICFKVKVLKTFETSTDCHIKTCRSLKPRMLSSPIFLLKRRGILKIPSTYACLSLEEPMLFLLALK